jgi:hypothetical protein
LGEVGIVLLQQELVRKFQIFFCENWQEISFLHEIDQLEYEGAPLEGVIMMENVVPLVNLLVVQIRDPLFKN